MVLGLRLSRGWGRGWPHSFYFGPISRTSDAGWEGVESFFSLSLSELPFQSDMHEAKQQGPQRGCPGGLGTQTMVSFADSYSHPVMVPSFSIHSSVPHKEEHTI